MKKFLMISVLFFGASFSTFAQNIDETTSGLVKIENSDKSREERKEMIRSRQEERRKNRSENGVDNMKFKDKIDSLSPEKKAELQKEMQRHRSEMKRIMGEDEDAPKAQ